MKVKSMRGATGRLSYGKVSNETLNPHIEGVKIAENMMRRVRTPPHSMDNVYDVPMCAFTDATSESHRGIVVIIGLVWYLGARERMGVI